MRERIIMMGMVVFAGMCGVLWAQDDNQPIAPTKTATKVAANNLFAFDLYRRLAAESEGNLFFSPISISTAFAMAHAGARGPTADQMAEVMHLALPRDQLARAFGSLQQGLRREGDTAGYRLHVANRLWGQQGYKFRPAFLRTTREDFGAPLAELDFVGHAHEARASINRWVEEQTESKIEDLIPEGVLDHATRLVLTNAIYFHGQWTRPFEPEATRELPFHLGADKTIPVPMMSQTASFRHAALADLQMLELPYGEKQELSTLILLPKEIDGLAGLEKTLSAKKLREWDAQMHVREVRLLLPRFRISSQFELSSTMQSLGMTLAFERNEADFSGMNGKRNLFISAALHKAYVDVNEEGTEAAAATGIGVATSAFKPVVAFRADRPFVLAIRDKQTGSMLFLGRLVHPKGEEQVVSFDGPSDVREGGNTSSDRQAED